MRPVGQGIAFEENDLKHLQRILKRARQNDIGRTEARRAQYITACQAMIGIVEQDIQSHWDGQKPGAKKKKVA